jgi:hypothetical protein
VSKYAEDPEAYFDLIISRAKRLLADSEGEASTQAFWRQRVGKAWRNAYQHMTRPSDALAGGLGNLYNRQTADRFAALAVEAAMAAWCLGIQSGENEDDPCVTAHLFLEMWERMPPSK